MQRFTFSPPNCPAYSLDIYLTATTSQHLTRQLNYVTSIVATQLSHFLSRIALG